MNVMPSALSVWPWNSREVLEAPKEVPVTSFPLGGTPAAGRAQGTATAWAWPTAPSIRQPLQKLPFNFLITLSSPAAQPASSERWAGIELIPTSHSPVGFDKDTGARVSSASTQHPAIVNQLRGVSANAVPTPGDPDPGPGPEQLGYGQDLAPNLTSCWARAV